MKANNPTSISGRGKWAAALSAIAILFIACTASAKDNVPFKGTFFRDLSEAVGQVYGRRRKSAGDPGGFCRRGFRPSDQAVALSQHRQLFHALARWQPARHWICRHRGAIAKAASRG